MPILGIETEKHRYAAIYELLDQQRLDAIVLQSGSYFQFATNFSTDVETWERPIACVVPRNGEPFAVLNALSTTHWRFGELFGKLWVKKPYFYFENDPNGEGVSVRRVFCKLLASIFKERRLERCHIGVEGPIPYGLRRALPAASIVDVTSACPQMRWVKHEEEIAVMRSAGALADWVQDRYRENIKPGILVQDLDARMLALGYQEAALRLPGEDLLLSCNTLSGPASAAPHGDGRSVGAKIESGHVIVNIVEPRLNGLVIENERTWFCGRPSSRQEAMFEAARSATEAACEAAITGNSVRDIDRAAFAIFKQAGFADLVLHRTGHGMGIACHEFPEDMSINRRPLRKGEVYSAEPGIYEWGLGGFRHDDTVVVGLPPEILTKSAKDLKSQTIL